MSETTEFDNGLSPAQSERLAMLAEEAGEIVQAVGKVLRHGYGSTHPAGGRTNRNALTAELRDLYAIVATMVALGDIESPATDLTWAWNHKLRYSHHQAPPVPA